MDIERALISKCIEGNVEKLVSRGVGPQHFEDEKNRAVFQTITHHMARYGAPPSRDAVLAKHPGYAIDIVQDTLDYILDLFVKKVQRREAQKSVLDLAAALDSKRDDLDIDSLFMEHAERVAQSIPSSRVSRLSDVPTRIQLYNKMLREGRIPGVPLGIPSLDKILLGVQKHELVVVSGASNVGKSTMLQYICLSSYLSSPDHRPVFISLEMEGDALLRKFDAMAVNFRYNALRALELHPEEMEKWETWGERAEKAPNDIIIIDDIADCTVERVFAETLRWKPSAMFVDYFGIMTPTFSGDKAYQGMAQMAKALKRVPRTTLTPVFTAAQTNRAGFKEGVRADNVADTIEIFRSADIMLGVERDDEEAPNEMVVKIVKSRDSQKGQTTMDWDMETMNFSEHQSFGKKAHQPMQGTTTLADFQAKAPDLPSNDPAIKTNPFLGLAGT